MTSGTNGIDQISTSILTAVDITEPHKRAFFSYCLSRQITACDEGFCFKFRIAYTIASC